MGRFSASASRRDAACRLAILSGALLALPTLSAAAQTTVIGGRTGPDVIVNESVIDSLGPPPTLPGLMRQENVEGVSPSSLRPFTLHPPLAHRTATVSKRKSPTQDQTEGTAVAAAPATAEPTASTSPLRTAIPLGKAPRTTHSKTRPVANVADTGATAPLKATKNRKGTSPRLQPVQSASAAPRTPPPAPAPAAPAPAAPAVAPAPASAAAPAPAAPAPAAASPSGPINSIVRRYPAGTGAAMLAASQPPPSSPPAPPAPANTPSTQAAAATPPAASAPAPSSPPASIPGPATTATPTPVPAAPATPAAAVTTPAPAASAQPAPPPQVAALAPSSGPPALPAQVVFAPNTSDTPDQAKSTLNKVVAAMKADDQIHVQLVAYASGLPDQASQARRISLQRAISVRSYLMEQGVKSTRIDVRALGNRTDVPGPQDRVDVVVTDR